MFGLGVGEIIALLLLGCLFEVVLFWASASLGDAPDTNLGKCLLAGLLVFALFVPGAWLVAYLSRLWGLGFASEPWVAAVLALGIARLALWPVLSLFYVPFVPVPVRKGVRIGVFQSLLGIFLYVLVVAVVMVGLAVNQIWRGDTQPKAARGGPAPAQRA
jgi:hypothetical protein